MGDVGPGGPAHVRHEQELVLGDVDVEEAVRAGNLRYLKLLGVKCSTGTSWTGASLSIGLCPWVKR